MAEVVGVASGVIAVLQISESVVTSCYHYAGKVKHARRDARRIIDEVESLTPVLNSIAALEDSGNSDSASLLENVELLKKNEGPLVRCKEELEDLQIKLEPKTGWKAAKHALSWPLAESDVEKTLQRIATFRETLGLALTADSTKLTLVIKTQNDAISGDTKHIREGFDEFSQSYNTARIDEDRSKILEWLQAPDSSADLETLSRARLDGTGAWLIEADQNVKVDKQNCDTRFQEWKESPSTLWLNGKSGSGKSVLSSLIIDHLDTLCNSRERWAFAYYFFSNISDEEKSTVSGWLAATIKQLISRDETVIIPECLKKLWKRSERPKTRDLSQALLALIRGAPRTYLVIDALDECSEREDLLDEIRKIMPNTDGTLRVHMLLTSRPEKDIRASLVESANSIPLQLASVQSDIQYYVSHILATDRKLREWSAFLKDDIQKALIEKADGTFRWVALQIADLRHCRTPRDVRTTLTSLPNTLEESYRRTLSRVNPKDQTGCRNMLHLLAINPLSIREAAELFVIDVDRNRIDVEARFMDPSEIMEICPGLIEAVSPAEVPDSLFTYTDGFSDATSSESSELVFTLPLTFVKLTHSSVLDYLLSCQSESSLALFRFEMGDAHFLGAKIFLLYLTTYSENGSKQCRGYRRSFGFWDGEEEIEASWPLLYYSSQAWQKHLAQFEASIGENSDEVRKSQSQYLDSLALRLFELEGNNCLEWTSAALAEGALTGEFTEAEYLRGASGPRNLLRARSTGKLPLLNRLPFICLSSAMCCCRPIFSHIRGTTATKNRMLSTKPGLSDLTRESDGAVLRLIYEAIMGLPNSPKQYYLNNLMRFLQYIIGIGYRDPGSLALISGAAKGNAPVVDLLLHLGVDVYAPDGFNEALYAAISFKTPQYGVAKLLLDRGADPNKPAQGLYWDRRETPTALLSYAAQRGDEELVDMLIQYGADVNADSGKRGSALHDAAIPNYSYSQNAWHVRGTMRQLISHGARIYPQREGYQRYLENGSSSEISKHLQYLKEAGAEQEDDQGIRTLDCRAIWSRHRELKSARSVRGWGDLEKRSDGEESPDELEWLQDDKATGETTVLGVNSDDADPTKSDIT